MNRPLLSVVILSFNTRELLKRCLSAVLDSVGLGMNDLEVVVVDNHSLDGSSKMVRQEFARVRLISNKANLGFSAGNNAGVALTRGEFVLLLNSDVVVNPETLGAMLDFVQTDPRIGAATCRLVLPNGELDPACHRGFPTPWNSFSYLVGLERLLPKTRLFGGYHRGWEDLTRPHEVDAIAGSFFLIPKRVILRVGGLDERFFMYGEDLDWCYRIKNRGFRVVFYPLTTSLHLKKQSGRAHASDMAVRKETQRHFIAAMELFYRKHYLKSYPRPVTWLMLWVIRLWKQFS